MTGQERSAFRAEIPDEVRARITGGDSEPVAVAGSDRPGTTPPVNLFATASAWAATDWLRHLLDGATVVVPFVSVGHHDRADPAASPVVARVFSSGDALPSHPYNGRPLALVETEGPRPQLLMLNIDRLAHGRGCPRCAPVWARYDEILDEIPAGSMISAVTIVHTSLGEARLVVDAADIEPDPDDDIDEAVGEAA